MSSPPPACDPALEMPSFAPRLWGIALVVSAMVLSGLWLVAQYTAADLTRDMQTWQEKLNLIAESRVSEVDQWVEGNFKDLRALADNPSLQLYMTELEGMPKPATGTPATQGESEPGERSYLRNLLLFTANRSGFTQRAGVAAIPANIPKEGKNGLLISDNAGNIVVSTQLQPATQEAMLEGGKRMQPGKEGLIDVQKLGDGTPFIGFSIPVYSIQGEHSAEGQIGRVIGLKTLGEENLFSLLNHQEAAEKTLEIMLVRKSAGNIEYISPLQDGSEALAKSTPVENVKSVESGLLQTPGNFLSDLKDYRGKPVLATSRAVSGTPWTLIVKIDRQEALARADQRRAGMVLVFFLLIAVVTLLIVAIWWHAHSRRSLTLSGHFKRLAARAMAQEKLLRLVADHQPESIYIVDRNQTVHFANGTLAEGAGMSTGSVTGKSLSDVRGSDRARRTADECAQALQCGEIHYDEQRVGQGEGEAVIRSAYVPLAHIPVDSLPEPTPGVLVVEQDISEAMHEREERLAMHRRLMETLLRLVDRRDRFAGNHSQMVSHIAQAVADEMELDDVTVEATRIAGSLMNIGKIVVPSELLTKTAALTDEEKRVVRDSMNAAADLLADIPFEGPVIETLRQWQEKWDGSGPMGLAGEAILISARIIAACNAFVGMISPRSWREAIPIDKAGQALLERGGKEFDRRVIIALLNYVENHHGQAWIKSVVNRTPIQ